MQKLALLTFAAVLSASCLQAQLTLLPKGGKTEWQYLDDGSDPGKEWSSTDFDSSAWKKGAAPLGYGEDDLGTELSFGEDAEAKHATSYFRTQFTIDEDETLKIEQLGLSLRADDGAVVYINGKEAVRSNMLAGSIETDTFASQAIGGSQESEFRDSMIPATFLSKSGVNTIAVEVHQADPGSSDLYLDLKITGFREGEAPKRDFYRDGMAAVQNRDYEGAARLLSQLPEDHPAFAETMAFLGHRLYSEALGRAEEGIPFAKKAYDLKPDDRNVLRAYIKSHVLSGTLFDPKSIARERPKKIAEEFKFLTTMTGTESPTLSRADLEADLDYLEHVLVHCFAYLELRPVDYRAALDAIRLSLKDKTPVAAFEVCIAKLITLFCDGHAGVPHHESQYLPRGFAPFIAGSYKDKIYLYKDGGEFLDEDHPYVKAIDGKPIAEWMKVAGYLVVKESPQWHRRQSLKMLRYVTYLRAELGLPNADTIKLTLESEDGSSTKELSVDVTGRLSRTPTFPEGDSRRMDDIGYLRIPQMTSSPRYLAELEDWMDKFRDTKGLIIDLRGNSGGTKDILFTLFPYFMDPSEKMKVVELSTYRMPMQIPKPAPQGFMMSDMSAQPVTSKRWTTDAQRKQVSDFIAQFEPEWKLPMEKFSAWHVLALDAGINENAYHYDKPLIILHDAGTFSAGDIFLGAFEDHPNTTLMGEASGGGNGWMEGYTLPNSKIPVTLCQSAKFRPNGKPYDGVGVPPNVAMEATPDDILGKSDTVLDAAVKRLRK